MTRARRTAWTLGLLAAWVLAVAGCQSGSGPATAAGRRVPASAWRKECDRWQGTAYQWGGNSRRGIDCSGFVQQVCRTVARVELPRTTRDQVRAGRAVRRRDLRPGDLVFFNTTGRGVSHVGLIVEGDRFAHASQSRGVTYARLGEPYWNRTFLGARRVVPRRAKTLTRRKTCQQTASAVLG